MQIEYQYNTNSSIERSNIGANAFNEVRNLASVHFTPEWMLGRLIESEMRFRSIVFREQDFGVEDYNSLKNLHQGFVSAFFEEPLPLDISNQHTFDENNHITGGKVECKGLDIDRIATRFQSIIQNLKKEEDFRGLTQAMISRTFLFTDEDFLLDCNFSKSLNTEKVKNVLYTVVPFSGITNLTATLMPKGAGETEKHHALKEAESLSTALQEIFLASTLAKNPNLIDERNLVWNDLALKTLDSARDGVTPFSHSFVNSPFNSYHRTKNILLFSDSERMLKGSYARTIYAIESRKFPDHALGDFYKNFQQSGEAALATMNEQVNKVSETMLEAKLNNEIAKEKVAENKHSHKL